MIKMFCSLFMFFALLIGDCSAAFKLPKGHEYNFMYILEDHYNFAGGIERKNVVDGLAVVSLDKLGLEVIPKLGKTEIFISVMGYHGKSPVKYVGDLQWTSNIDTAHQEGVHFFESYFRQDIFTPDLKFRFGLIDPSLTYNINDPALLFVHSSPGTSAELGASGPHGAPIYPYVSWGADLQYFHQSGFYAMAVVTDEYSGNKKDPSQTQKSFRIDPNYNFHILEVGLKKDLFKIGAGYWGYAKLANHLSQKDDAGTAVRSINKKVFT